MAVHETQSSAAIQVRRERWLMHAPDTGGRPPIANELQSVEADQRCIAQKHVALL